MQLILFIIVFISFYTSASLNNLPHSCESEIYCYGPLLHDVQLSNLYPDSKTFVDLALKASPKEVLQAFDELKKVHENLTLDEIKSFVDKYFEEGDELETWNPPDWTPTPSIAGRVHDIKVKDWVLQLNHIWKTLSRKIKEDVHKNPDHYSLIYVPNGFVIPGGRFRELYYWDTYWIIKGLLLCDMKDTAKGVIENLLHLVEVVGFVPNGNRVYYRERSQPPLLTQMVDYYFQETGDVEFVKAAFPVLKKETKWWLDNRSIMINYEGKEYLMFRYNAPSDGPRPESYREDIETASTCKDDTTCRSLKYTALKSGAESGWDFSSRWFIDGTHSCGNIKNIDTGNIIPVDLNSFLHKNFKILSSYQAIVGDESDEFAELANKLQLSIDQVLFDEIAGIWFDYDLKNMVRRKFFYASNLTPLWTKSYDISKRDVLSKNVLKYITTVQLQSYPGGTPSSLLNSGQQWDMPNAWPPLQSIVVYGLDSLGTPEAKNVARKLANTWVTSNYKAFASSSHMFEKYNSNISGGAGGGGEYDVQAGFGWTNGVVLEMINSWPMITV